MKRLSTGVFWNVHDFGIPMSIVYCLSGNSDPEKLKEAAEDIKHMPKDVLEKRQLELKVRIEIALFSVQKFLFNIYTCYFNTKKLLILSVVSKGWGMLSRAQKNQK